MSDNDNTQAIIDAIRSEAPVENHYAFIDEVEANGIPVMRVHSEATGARLEVMHEVLKTTDERADAPRRLRGSHAMTELASFVEHIKRFGLPNRSIVYAEVGSFTLTAVYNEHHGNASPAWRDFRSYYQCPRSPAWTLWTGLDGKGLTQDQFADHIEANLEHLTHEAGYPPPTEILQMARDLTVLSKGTFQRQVNPTTGAGILVCKTETETGSTVIPRAFLLAIPVFDGGTLYRVEARIRFVLANGSPVFTYALHRRTEIERDAFGDVRAAVAVDTGLPVWAGRPG